MNIHIELQTWKNYIKSILIHHPVYIKGGSVIGIECMKILLTSKDQFEVAYKEFKQLNLIKDWDFILYSNDIPTYENISREGDKLIIMRYKTIYERITIDAEAFIEMSIKSSEDFSSLEIPMTSMKIEINLNNIDFIFELIEKLYFNDIDYNNLKYLLNKFNVIIYDYDQYGLFVLTNLDEGNLSQDMLDIIKNNNSISIQQFLISQIIQPDRLFLRLMNKNIPKSNKIKNLFSNYHINYPNWLMNEEYIMLLKNNFVQQLTGKINHIYNTYSANLLLLHEEYNNKLKLILIYHNTIDIINNNLHYQSIIDILMNRTNIDKLPKQYQCILKKGSIESINKKIIELHELNSFCIKEHIYDKLEFIQDDVMSKYIQDKYLTEYQIKLNIILKEKLIIKHDILKIYESIFGTLSILFKEINLGRLAQVLNKIDVHTMNEIINVFGSIVYNMNINLLKKLKTKGYANEKVKNFIMTLINYK